MNQALANAIEWARKAAALLDWQGDTYQVIATQFLREKGDAYWENPGPNWNFGNVRAPGGNFYSYQNGFWGVASYATVMTNGLYADVMNAGQAGDVAACLIALEDSPWCDPPYGKSLTRDYESWFGALPAISQASVDASGPAEDAASAVPTTLAELRDHPIGYYGPEWEAYQRDADIVAKAAKEYHYGYFEQSHNPIGVLYPPKEMMPAQHAAARLWRKGFRR